jgi:hypothetical protein
MVTRLSIPDEDLSVELASPGPVVITEICLTNLALGCYNNDPRSWLRP